MNLTPGEKAVLKALQMQWTPSHYEAYQRAFGSLLEKQLVEDAGVQSFRITDQRPASDWRVGAEAGGTRRCGR